MFRIKLALLVVVTLLLNACATTTLSYATMKSLVSPPTTQQGRIYFYRERAILGNIVTPDITLNGTSVGTSEPGSFFFVDRPAGTYAVACGKDPERTASFDLAAGQEVYVKTSLSPSILVARMDADVMDRMAAIPQIQSLDYTGAQISMNP